MSVKSQPVVIRTVGIVGVVVVALTVAACGDENDDVAAKAPVRTPIKVAVLIDVSGPASGQQADAVDVLEAWVKSTNDGGGVADRPVELGVTDKELPDFPDGYREQFKELWRLNG